MFNIIKDTLSFLSKSLYTLKDYIFGVKSVSISEENTKISTIKKENYSHLINEKSNSLDYIIFLVDKSLTYENYLTHIKYLEEKLHLSKKFARINIELVCNTRETEKAVIFNLPKVHTLYEDTYMSEMQCIYKEILEVSDRYNVKCLLSVNMNIRLYSKNYKIKTLER